MFEHPWDYGRLLLGLVALPLITFAIHEGIHGVVFKTFGGKSRYGTGIKHWVPYAYTTVPNQLFPRNAFVIILVAPLVVINSAALLLLGIFPQLAGLGWVVVVNTSGAIGDLWITSIVCCYPVSVSVEDRRDGIAIYASKTVGDRYLTHLSQRFIWLDVLWQTLSLAIAIIVLLNILSLLLPIPLDLLRVPPFRLAVGDWMVFQWMRGETGFEVSFNPLATMVLAPVIASLLVALKARDHTSHH